jgi:F0F1-type ATP synthase membrane subunit b/b'
MEQYTNLQRAVMAVLANERKTAAHTIADADQIIELCAAENAKLRAEVEQLTKHAKEGWDLANERTRQWKASELQVKELSTALERISQSSVDVVARGWADEALGYTQKQERES